MIRRVLAFTTIAISVAAVWLIAQTAQNPASLAQYFPPGALLFIEAKDFSATLSDWNKSDSKSLWLKSDNQKAFSNSRLLLRLQQAQDEFAVAAGVPPAMPLLQSVAGGQSALALYDISDLHFLYVTRLASAKAMEAALWQKRSAYESRSLAGVSYFVRTGPGKRTAAFAATNGYLILATREDLMAGAVQAIAGTPNQVLTQESWYQAAVRQGKSPGEIRMVMNMTMLVKSHQFRNYWIQRNVEDLKQYTAGIADVFRTADQIREERVLIRGEAGRALTSEEDAAAQVLAYVPDRVGFYQAWASPTSSQAAELVWRKVVQPGRVATIESKTAPGAANPDAVAGSESDLESRIDEAAFSDTSGTVPIQPFRDLADKAGLRAMLLVQSNRPLGSEVFAQTPTAIVMTAQANWDRSALQTALPGAAVSVQGSILVIASDNETLQTVNGKLAAAPTSDKCAYAAGVAMAQELPLFTRLMHFLDVSRKGTEQGEIDGSPNADREPELFSENIPSLVRSLPKLTAVSIRMHDNGATVPHTVLYRHSQ